MRQREWARCNNPEELLRQAAVLLRVPTEAELAARRRRQRRSGQAVPEFPWETEAARTRRCFRLFTLTAGQPVLERLNDADCHRAAEVGWRLAEGIASAEEVAAAEAALAQIWEASLEATRAHFQAPIEMRLLPRLVNVLVLLFREPDGAARNLIVPQSIVHPGQPVPLLTHEETRDCCSLIREIFGIRHGQMPLAGRLTWRTDTTTSLARQMYESREFSAMPILADALQDAGCDSDDILSHCRDTSATHVRGCWVIDLVLGKA